MPAAGLAYFGNGFDLADPGGAPPTGWDGAPVVKGRLAVAAALRNASLAPHAGGWRPLNLSAQALAFPSGGSGWDAYSYSYTTESKGAGPVVDAPGEVGCFMDPVCPSDWNPLAG